MINQIRLKAFFSGSGSTLLLYTIAAIIIYLAEKVAPSGICNPGLGALLLIFTPVLSTLLLIKNLNKDIDARRLTASTIIHLAVAVSICSLFF